MPTLNLPLITIDEYVQMPLDGWTELVRGRIEHLDYSTPGHGMVCGTVGRMIGTHVDIHELGHVVVNAGIVTQRDPDTVRGADVWFVAYDKVPRGTLPDDYLDLPPDIVIEVLSKSDRWRRVLQKISEYLSVGVPVVCVLDPRNKTARLYSSDESEQILTADDVLTFPNQLPGFSVRVGELFESAEED